MSEEALRALEAISDSKYDYSFKGLNEDEAFEQCHMNAHNLEKILVELSAMRRSLQTELDDLELLQSDDSKDIQNVSKELDHESGLLITAMAQSAIASKDGKNKISELQSGKQVVRKSMKTVLALNLSMKLQKDRITNIRNEQHEVVKEISKTKELNVSRQQHIMALGTLSNEIRRDFKKRDYPLMMTTLKENARYFDEEKVKELREFINRMQELQSTWIEKMNKYEEIDLAIASIHDHITEMIIPFWN